MEKEVSLQEKALPNYLWRKKNKVWPSYSDWRYYCLSINTYTVLITNQLKKVSK